MNRFIVLSTLLLVACTASAQMSGWYPAGLSVSTITNVDIGDNASGCKTCGPFSMLAVIGLPPCQPYKAPTEKWAITNIIQRSILGIRWSGREFLHTNDVILSESTNRWVLTSDWKPAPAPLPNGTAWSTVIGGSSRTNYLTTDGGAIVIRSTNVVSAP